VYWYNGFLMATIQLATKPAMVNSHILYLKSGREHFQNEHDVNAEFLFPSEEHHPFVRLTKRTFSIEHHGPNLKPNANLHQEWSTL